MSPRHDGFTLIELLIGVAISLLGLVAVGQIMLAFNQQRNTIAQTQATQNNGVMALYLMEKDIAQAGYGLMGLQNCDRIHFFNGSGYHASPFGTTDLPGSNSVALTTLPVRIIDGGSGADGEPLSDIIEVQYGSSNSGVPGAAISAAQASDDYSSPYALTSGIGFATGDLFVANVDNQCTLGAVTNASPTLSLTVEHDVSDSYNSATQPAGASSGWNAATTTSLAATPTPFVSNLGAFVSRRFSIADETVTSALNVAELPNFTTNNLVDDIVLIKAQYGLAANSTSTTVASWATGATLIDNTTAARVIAVRIGVVARSPLYEKNEIDAPANLTVLPEITSGGATIAAGVTWPVPDQHYRYRSFSTIIPLKNVIWTR